MNRKAMIGAAMCMSASLAFANFGCTDNRNKTDKEAMAAKSMRPPRQPPAVPKAVATPIDLDLRVRAQAEINKDLEQGDPILRANAVEALQLSSTADDARVGVLQALDDASTVVRFAGCMAAGQLKIADARGKLVQLASDKNRSVRVASRYALHRLGDTSRSHDLEKFAGDPDRSVRANTAMVLGLLGEKSALRILETMTNDSQPSVRIQVAEAMWRLGSEDALRILVAGTISKAGDDQIVSVLAIAGPKDDNVTGHVRAKLTSEYPEVALAAARGMGQLGYDDGYTVAQNGAKATDPRQRALAALALGAIGRSDAQPMLDKLLSDSDASVRLAAATAVLQIKA